MIPLREDAAFRDGVMRCVRCSICVPHCPSYAVFRAESDSPRGRVQLLRAVVEGRVEADATLERHLDRCLGCRACEDVCPSGVPYGALLERAREELRPSEHARGRKWATRVFLEKIVASRFRLALVTRLVALMQWLRLDRLLGRIARRAAPALTKRIELLPRPAGAPFDPEEVPRPAAPTAAFHAGCVMASALGDVQRAALRVLARSGHAVAVPAAQRCCGALHLHAGLLDTARELAKENIAAFERIGAESAAAAAPIVTTSAGCALAMKEYGQLLAGDPDWAARARAFSIKIRDLSEVAEISNLPAAPSGTLAVQEACHHWNVQQLRGRALSLLRSAGADAVPLPRGAGCCGAAGLWSAQYPEEAGRLLEPLLDAIERSGCTAVVSSNPGCLFHLRAGLRARRSPVRALHLAEVLDEASPVVTPGAGGGPWPEER